MDVSSYKQRVSEIFYGTPLTDQEITDAIRYVVEEENDLSDEERLEAIINVLLQAADGAQPSSSGASGMQQPKPENDILKNLFPDICPHYLASISEQFNTHDLSEIIEHLSANGYRKMNETDQDQAHHEIWEHLKQMLPNADPIYLRNQARVLVHRPTGELEQFISNAIENDDYPTLSEYIVKQQKINDMAFYLNNFSPSTFLEKIPNPLEKFLSPDYKSPLSLKGVDSSDIELALDFLYNQFVYLRKKEIESIFNGYNKNLVKVCGKLKTMPKSFRHPRQIATINDEEIICKNMAVLQEITFLKHEIEIRQFIKQKDEKYRAALDEARAFGLLQTCGCCFDDELIPEECLFCMNGCIFCKDCVKIGAETAIGEGKLTFPCLADCDDEFSMSTLQMVLDKKVFQRLCQRKQIDEIRKANIEGLENCPFCDFCTVPPHDSKIFKCENIDCMKESCRECRHISHIPLRCSEIEYDEDVKVRVYIEEKMTEALLRQCPQCKREFLKETGCNKMTCSCGTRMCYVCKKQINDYSHFSEGPGGCPLTSNIELLHFNNVVGGAERAKNELGVDKDPKKLKFDPTRGLTA